MPQQTQIPGTESLRRLNRDQVIALILEPFTHGYGFRHLWIGYTGSGKSYANVELVKAAAEHVKYVIVTDQKNRETAYDGEQIPSISALAACEPDDEGHIEAVIRGLAMTNNVDDTIDFDVIGKAIWQLSLRDEGVLLGIDELSDACEGERVWVRGLIKRSYMRLLYSQGRTKRISIAACTQNVQEVPRAAISNSDTLGIFRQDRKELPYYAATRFLDAIELEAVANLGEHEFLFLKRGQETCVSKF